MLSSRTEDLGQQVGRTVDHLGLLRKSRSGSNKSNDLDDPNDAIEPDQGIDCRESVESAQPRRLGGVFDGDALAQLTDARRSAVDERQLPPTCRRMTPSERRGGMSLRGWQQAGGSGRVRRVVRSRYLRRSSVPQWVLLSGNGVRVCHRESRQVQVVFAPTPPSLLVIFAVVGFKMVFELAT